MKKLIGIFLGLIFLTGCAHKNEVQTSQSSSKSTSVHRSNSKSTSKIDLTKKYKNLKLMTIPSEFYGTWWRSDQFSKRARSLKIDAHTVNGSVVYYQTKPFRRDHNSEKLNKEYPGDLSIGEVTNLDNRSALRVWDILGTVDLVYLKGTFNGNEVLYLAYSSGDIHGALFKDPKLAIKYRNYPFDEIK